MRARLASGMLLIAVLATACSRTHKSSVVQAAGGAGGDTLGADSTSDGANTTSTDGDAIHATGGVETATGEAGASDNGGAGGSTGTSSEETGAEATSGAGGSNTTGMGGVGTTSTDEGSSGVNTASTGGTGGGAAPSTGSGGTASSSTGGSDGGGMTCETGMVPGSEVLVIGDSFIAISEIVSEIEKQAREAGALSESESYRAEAISGSRLAGGAGSSIPNQYNSGVAEGPAKVVLMNGGGTDCQNNEPDTALAAAEALFQTMEQSGTEQVVYFFYPDPIGGLQEALRACLDELRLQMQALCEGLTAPKCYWLDLRQIWDGHPDYTSDGIHPTNAGSVATGEAIWDVMVENCVAQ